MHFAFEVLCQSLVLGLACWNCSGGGNMMSSLTFFHVIGLIISACSLMLSLGFLASCFNSNLISCILLNLLRSFLFIFILYDLVLKPLLGKVVILLLSFIFISIYIYYSHISLSLFECTSLSIF